MDILLMLYVYTSCFVYILCRVEKHCIKESLFFSLLWLPLWVVMFFVEIKESVKP